MKYLALNETFTYTRFSALKSWQDHDGSCVLSKSASVQMIGRGEGAGGVYRLSEKELGLFGREVRNENFYRFMFQCGSVLYVYLTSLGSFSTASCTNCKYQVSCEAIREDVFQQVSQ